VAEPQPEVKPAAVRTENSAEESKKRAESGPRVGGQQKTRRGVFSIMGVVKDDQEFEEFWGRFAEMRDKCDLEQRPVPQYAKEEYFGNIEYKLKLANPDFDRVEHLTT
jgi:hypothetical protein